MTPRNGKEEHHIVDFPECRVALDREFREASFTVKGEPTEQSGLACQRAKIIDFARSAVATVLEDYFKISLEENNEAVARRVHNVGKGRVQFLPDTPNPSVPSDVFIQIKPERKRKRKKKEEKPTKPTKEASMTHDQAMAILEDSQWLIKVEVFAAEITFHRSVFEIMSQIRDQGDDAKLLN